MVVQHNLRAMNSSRMLGLTANVQSKSAEKLSSVYKINRAADDAAGLAISEKMRKQIRGLSQASLNAADGISAVQTAEGALNEVQDMLQRMNELAVKASNGTMSTDDRSYIQDEIDQLITEIDRVSETTKFNETYLLKGDENAAKAKDFDYKDAPVISQDLYYVKDGAVQTLKAGTLAAAVDTDVSYYSSNVGPTAGIKYAAGDTGAAILESKANVLSVADSYYAKGEDGYYVVEKGTVIDTTADYYTAAAGTDPIDSNMTLVKGSDITAKRNEFFVASGATVYDSTGASVKEGTSIGATAGDISKYYKELSTLNLGSDTVDIANYQKNDKVQFVDKEGNEIAANGLYRYLDKDGKLNSKDLFVKTGEGVTDHRAATQEDVDALVTSKDHAVGALTLKLHVGADATRNNQISVDIESMSAKVLGVDSIRVDGLDDSNALNAIETIREALNKVSDQRSALGAVQNRLEHTINNLDNVVENTTAAESQIRDTDMATEMVKFSNNNILAQAGQAMLAQANQANQGVLSILG